MLQGSWNRFAHSRAAYSEYASLIMIGFKKAEENVIAGRKYDPFSPKHCPLIADRVSQDARYPKTRNTWWGISSRQPTFSRGKLDTSEYD